MYNVNVIINSVNYDFQSNMISYFRFYYFVITIESNGNHSADLHCKL